jgi:phosphoribosyl-dephospho-CoA transferase
MVALRRHQLVRLNATGWAALQQQAWDDAARGCLAHWAAHHLPLVVTQQREGLSGDQLALGLPAPLQWQRRRFALQASLRDVLYFDEFPAAADVTPLLPVAVRAAWRTLTRQLERLDAAPRVYGSVGWQRLTGLTYLHAASDVDLRLSVVDAATADAVAARLNDAAFAAPRIDGELVFADGSAVAWREWLACRAGRVERMLVKRLHGVAMEAGDRWLREGLAC